MRRKTSTEAGTNTSPSGKSGSSGLGRLLDGIGTAILVIAVILCLSLAVPKLFGISSYAVITGSMEPTIPVGSMVYAKYAAPSGLTTGDIVVFYDGMSDVPVTHRLVENDQDQGLIITQGDANTAPDPTPILYPNIIGKVVLHLPVAGSLLSPLGTLQGKLSLISIILGAMLLSMAGKRARRT